MIVEIAVTATLSAGLLGYMIGKAGKEAIRARADHWRLRANEFNRKRLAAELELISINRKRLAAELELISIKRQRSDNTRRGNITKRLKREAAKVSA